MWDVPSSAVDASLLEFLEWISRDRRTYTDAMDEWKTHCPRLSVWEDALASGLVEVRRSGGANGSTVALTETGKAALRSNSSS